MFGEARQEWEELDEFRSILNVGEVGIRSPSVMLLKHMHFPILESAMKLN